MADTFFMQCEEEELAPCQSSMNGACLTPDINTAVQDGSLTISPTPFGCTAESPSILAVQSSGVTTNDVSDVPEQVSPNVLQQIQMAATSTDKQSLYITSQEHSSIHENITSPVGYLLPTSTGQSVAFLTSAHTSQIITAQLASASSSSESRGPGKYTTVQFPLSLTIHGPSGIQSLTAVAEAGMPALSTTKLLPLSSPADPAETTTPHSPAVVSPLVQAPEVPESLPNRTVTEAVPSHTDPPSVTTQKVPVAVTTQNFPVAVITQKTPVAVSTPNVALSKQQGPVAVTTCKFPVSMSTHAIPTAVPSVKVPVEVPSHNVPSSVSTRALVSTHAVTTRPPGLSIPGTVPTQATSWVPNQQAPKPQAQISSSHAVITKVFQGASRPPQICSVCGASYKVVHSLRGYLCQCNQELIKNFQALSVQPRKRKARRVSQRSPVAPLSSSTSASGWQLSASPLHSHTSLKNITTSEIPEGVLSPGTGDYDQYGKLIILVEDFFYGKDPGQPVLIENNQVACMMKCHLCDKRLKNNIKLMNHMKHHMEMDLQMDDMDCHTMCQHCFRNFSTPFTLQCHVETVHSQVECTALCKICELSFENEPLFLNHMKNTHKPGEMPYVCQVCNFRSSFYQDVIAHFRELHKDTNYLQCPYCLKVFKYSNSYQMHYSKHQKKSVQHCDKCRLQFLYSKEKADHKTLFHQTHLKPVQLLGLKPGTKVTIRAYTVRKIDDSSSFQASNMNAQAPALKVISNLAPSVPVPQCASQKITPTKRKPVESMLEIMTKFQSQCEPAKKRFCMECNFEIPDFSSHFPTCVYCSLCHYRTCCSRAYANHMISNHVSRKTTTKYLNLYKPCPKLGTLSCYTCEYTTEVGDLMAKHLVAHPAHHSSHCKFSEGFSRGYKRFVYIPSDLIRFGQRQSTGTFVPLHLLQVGQDALSNPNRLATHTTQVINLPVRSAHMPSIPVQVQPVDQSTVPDENCGTEPKDSNSQNRGLLTGARAQSENTVGGSLTLGQLKIIFYALCFGVPQAANHFDTQPKEVQSLICKRQLQLGLLKNRKGLNSRGSDQMAEWVLCQHEQQLPITEGNLFSKALEIVSKEGGPGISYEWAVDFLLQRNLGLQALATTRQLLPPKAQEHVQYFTQFMTKQVTSQGFGKSFIGAMDELSIFIDIEQLDPASADSSSMMSAFKLVDDSDPLMDIVVVGLADGTILPTMLFLKGEPPSPDAPSLPNIIVLEAKPEGFSDEERLQLWLDKVWRPHVDPSSGGKGLLVMDTYRGHISDDFLASLNSANTLPGIVPRSCSCHLQPLEACVGPVLREFLQARWSQHVMEAPQDLIGAEPTELAFMLATWLMEVMDVISAKPELLQRSFDHVLSSSSEMKPADLSKLVHTLTEALIFTTFQGQEAEETVYLEENSTSDVTFMSPLPSPPANSQALKKIFEKDSDLESFHGFEDAEMADC
ncbi:pogo transposable element with ZNF domain isoform X2 [Hoplias malabaricus]|uniref:pogo transposable element with ZNF domain isoform X2 n=1 Tax=Hoplias malabaricus TaxID=27720 RepID=UPI0034626A4F